MNTKELGGYQVLQESEKTPGGAEGKSSFPAVARSAPELAVEVGIISGFNNS
jgi:hypothetical protein